MIRNHTHTNHHFLATNKKLKKYSTTQYSNIIISQNPQPPTRFIFIKKPVPK